MAKARERRAGEDTLSGDERPSLSVFISSSRDLAHVAAEVAIEIRAMIEELGLGPPNIIDYRDIDPATLDHARPWQDQIRRPSEEGVDLVVVLFGERVGKTLPSNFKWSSDIAARLHDAGLDWVHVSGVHGERARRGKVPLTGTLFEFFDATLPRAESKNRPRTLVIFWGTDEPSGHVAFGDGRWLSNHVAEPGIPQAERTRRSEEHNRQVRYLEQVYAKLFDSEHNVRIVLNRSEDLAAALRRAVLESLGIGGAELDPTEVELPGLAPYDLSHSALYRGRREELRRLGRLVFADDGPQKLITVIGESGCGKSSLLRSGLMGMAGTRVRKARNQRSAFISLSEIASTTHPLASIAEVMAQAWPELGAPTALAQRMECPGHEAVARLLDHLDQAFGGAKDAPSLIFVVDQAEVAMDRRAADMGSHDHWAALLDLFRQCRGAPSVSGEGDVPRESRRLLARAQLTIVAAVALHRAEEFHQHVPPHDEHEMVVSPRLSTETLRGIVSDTFNALRLRVESKLVDDIVEQAGEIAETAPVLPLLAEALRRLHESWKARMAQSPLSALWKLEWAEQGAARRLRDALQRQQPLSDPMRQAIARAGGVQLLSVVQALKRMSPAAIYGAMVDTDPVIRAAHFADFGGMAGLIDTLGEEAIALVPPPAERGVDDSDSGIDRPFQGLMRKLVLIAPSYRRTPDHLRTIRGERVADDERPLLEALLSKRLTVGTSDGGYRLIHEAILRHWKRAAAWREEEKGFYEIYDRARSACDAWVAKRDQAGANAEAYLLPNAAQFGDAIDLLARWGVDFDETLTVFVKASSITLGRNDPDVAGRATIAATYRGDSDWLRAALAASPDVRRSARFVSSRGGNALCNAVMRQDESAIELLLAAGARPDLKASRGNTAWHHAADVGSVQVAMRLATRTPFWKRGNALNALNDDGMTPVMYAFGSDLELAVWIVRNGGKRQLVSPTGETAAHVAAAHVDILSMRCAMARRVVYSKLGLRTAGYDPRVLNAVNDRGATPSGVLAAMLAPLWDVIASSLFRPGDVARLQALAGDGEAQIGESDEPDADDAADALRMIVAPLIVARAARLAPADGSPTEVFEGVVRSVLAELDLMADDTLVEVLHMLLFEAEALREELLREGFLQLQAWLDIDEFQPWPEHFRWSHEPASLVGARRALRRCKTNLDAFAVARFSFMPQCEFVEVGRGSGRAFAFCSPAGTRLFDKTNEAIYWLGDRGLIELNDATVKDYVAFFFHMVRGKLGAFTIASRAEDLRWQEPESPPQEPFDACAALIRPLELTGRLDGDGWRLRAFVQFKNALFSTDVEVQRNGQMQLSNEDLLIEDLPLKY